MNVLPCAAKSSQVIRKRILNASHILALESIILENGHRPCGTIESEYRFTTISDDVDVSGPVIVEINSHANLAKPQDSWHRQILTQNLTAWVNYSCRAKG
jgi:hypothetical protein